MNILCLCAALALGAAAAPANGSEKAREKIAEKTLIEHPPVQWLKLYELPVSRESWRVEGAVKSLAADLPRVKEAFAKVGASFAGTEEAAGKARRLSFRCPKESAKKALAGLGKVGSFKEPAVRQSVEPVSAAELDGKIAALEAEKSARAAELARMPVSSALLEELLGHLRGVKASLGKPEVTVLVVVKEKGS